MTLAWRIQLDIYIAGGLHDDPTCRIRFADWFGQLVAARGNPAFIGVEMDDGIRHMLRVIRERFKGLATGLWGDAAEPAVLNMLADTMAWEVDAHRAACPELEPVFLEDANIHASSSGVDHLQAFASFRADLGGFDGDRKSPAEVAAWVSSSALARADRYGLDTYTRKRDLHRRRERQWHYALRFETRKPGYGVAVIGALHASRHDPETFRRLLERDGHQVAVEYLSWRPPVEIE